MPPLLDDVGVDCAEEGGRGAAPAGTGRVFADIFLSHRLALSSRTMNHRSVSHMTPKNETRKTATPLRVLAPLMTACLLLFVAGTTTALPMLGDVEGNASGAADVTGDVTGDLGGDVAGDISGSADVSA